MIEVDFKDRLPKYPGRVKMTPVPGQMDVFEMARMDEPTEPGTPLDKATFDGISKNRLTGCFYDLSANKTTLSSTGGANNPLPTTWNNATATGANTTSYSITASGSTGSNYPHKAFDGSTSTYWTSNTAKEPWIQLNVPESVTVTKMKIAMRQPDSWATSTVIQGQQSNGSWVNLNTFSLPDNSLREYTLSPSNTYKAYRLKFTIYTDAVIELYEWQISNWSFTTYKFDYTLPKTASPTSWVKWQRVSVYVPNNDVVGVVSNTLNGIQVNTILQPNRKYELVYNGSSFDAKEV